jgi:hypothetical protein
MSVGTNSIGGQGPPLQGLILGTRGSELARAQTRMVETGLRASWADLTIETKVIRTSGDEGKAGEEMSILPCTARKIYRASWRPGRR